MYHIVYKAKRAILTKMYELQMFQGFGVYTDHPDAQFLTV